VVRALISFGADPNARRSPAGDPPLLTLCWMGRAEAAAELLGAGALPDTAGHAGWTPLMRAAFDGDEHITEVLLEAGANVHVPNAQDDGMDAVEYAAEGGHVGCLQLMFDADDTCAESITRAFGRAVRYDRVPAARLPARQLRRFSEGSTAAGLDRALATRRVRGFI
jgi:ankyrin repeat protein